jgi:hypothetical protein
VKLERCVATGAQMQCDFQVTALREDQRLRLFAREGTGSRLVDQDGNEVRATYSKIGSEASQAWSDADLVQGVPMRAALIFEKVASGAKTLQLLQVGFSQSRSTFSLKFKGVTIER